ncbi:MAG: hypothetical protein JW850_00275 [Thermoflexales bacterium]|nr:hypothetical protein [Thermoflexales bacterium]
MNGEQSKQERYLSYMLRLWETSSEDDHIWRASLESPGSGKRLGFASLEELFAFLKDETKQARLPQVQKCAPDKSRPG